MQPLRLRIEGSFWDSLLYSGRLYLWDFGNRLRVYDWDQIVDSVADDSAAVTCAFSRSDLLYRVREETVLVNDPLISNALAQGFAAAGEREFAFSLSDLESAKIGEQDSPCDTLHDDAVLHFNKLFLLTESGLYYAGLQRRRKYAVWQTAERCWDGIAVHIDAKSGWLALAAASDGVFQLNVSDESYEWGEPESVSARHCTFVNWAFSSIYASSNVGNGGLVGFRWSREEHTHDIFGDSSLTRVFEGEFDEGEILASANIAMNELRLSWAADDKIYFGFEHAVDVLRFTQKYLNDPSGKAFQALGEIPFHGNAAILSGTGCLFGTVIERTDGLSVLLSDGSRHDVAQAPVRWRVFPRSKRYENQLHLIFDDYLEVLSFNQDYAVDQKTKLAGSSYRTRRLWRGTPSLPVRWR